MVFIVLSHVHHAHSHTMLENIHKIILKCQTGWHFRYSELGGIEFCGGMHSTGKRHTYIVDRTHCMLPSSSFRCVLFSIPSRRLFNKPLNSFLPSTFFFVFFFLSFSELSCRLCSLAEVLWLKETPTMEPELLRTPTQRPNDDGQTHTHTHKTTWQTFSAIRIMRYTQNEKSEIDIVSAFIDTQ